MKYAPVVFHISDYIFKIYIQFFIKIKVVSLIFYWVSNCPVIFNLQIQCACKKQTSLVQCLTPLKYHIKIRLIVKRFLVSSNKYDNYNNNCIKIHSVSTSFFITDMYLICFDNSVIFTEFTASK